MIHWRKGTWYGDATGEGRGTMNTTTIRFLKAGMAYLLLGGFLGVLLSLPVTRDALYASHPGARWGLAHAHIVLAGFVMMVIFGIAYHILPRFAGKPLHSEGWAAAPPAARRAGDAGRRLRPRGGAGSPAAHRPRPCPDARPPGERGFPDGKGGGAAGPGRVRSHGAERAAWAEGGGGNRDRRGHRSASIGREVTGQEG